MIFKVRIEEKMRGGAGEVGVVGEEKQVFNEEQDWNISKQRNSVNFDDDIFEGEQKHPD